MDILNDFFQILGLLLGAAFMLHVVLDRWFPEGPKKATWHSLLLFGILGILAGILVVPLSTKELGDLRLAIICIAATMGSPLSGLMAVLGSIIGRFVSPWELTWLFLVNNLLALGLGIVLGHWYQKSKKPARVLAVLSLFSQVPGAGMYILLVQPVYTKPLFELGLTYFVLHILATYLTGYLLLVEMQRRKQELAARVREEAEASRYQAVMALSQMSGKSTRAMLDFTLECSLSSTGSTIGYIYFYNEDTQILTLWSWSRGVMDQCRIAQVQTEYELSKTGLWGDAIRERKPTVCNDYPHAGTEKKGLPKGHVALIRHLNIPVFEDGKIVALVGVANKPSPYTDHDVRYLGLFLDDVWRVIRTRMDSEKTQAMNMSLASKVEDSLLRYQTLFDTMVQGVVIHRPDGTIEALNEAARKILGTDDEAAIGSSPKDPQWLVIHEDGSMFPAEEHPSNVSIRTGETCSNVIMGTFNRTDQAYRWILVNSVPVYRKDTRELTGVFVVFADITRERLALENTRLFFNVTLELLGIADRNGVFTLVNPAWEQTLGWTEAEISSRPFMELVHPDDQAGTLEKTKDLLEQGSQVQNFVNRYRCKDGTWRWLSWNALGLPHRKVIIAAAHDITLQREKESELDRARQEAISAQVLAEQANSAKSEFLANMSHEIRTPLNAVIGFSELLEHSSFDEKQHSYLAAIRSAGNSLLTLINDILDLSRIEASSMEICLQESDIHLIAEDIARIFLHKVHEKNIEFRMRVQDRVPRTLLIDPARIRQILLNLCGNAIKFTSTGYVSLEIDWVQSDLVLRVIDTGIGIPLSDQGRIFGAFQQQSTEINRRFGGTGLGLSISSKLVDLMKGRISLESTPGKGSIFTVEIPASDSSGEAMAISSPSTPVAMPRQLGSGMKILIADDIESNRTFLKALLEAEGCSCHEADTGIAAIEQAQAHNPDLIIMDLFMPEMDGISASLELQKIEACRTIPIVALTASSDSRDHDRARQAGIKHVLLKPLRVQELFGLVRTTLRLDTVRKNAENLIHRSLPSLAQPDRLALKELLDSIHAGPIRMGDVKKITDLLSESSEDAQALGEILGKQGESYNMETVKHIILYLHRTLNDPESAASTPETSAR